MRGLIRLQHYMRCGIDGPQFRSSKDWNSILIKFSGRTVWPIKLLECHWCWRGEAGKAQEGYAGRGRCQSLGMAVHISIFISTPGSALFYKERVEMSLEEFVAGERWMTPEEQAEHDYDQCLRAD